jgi:phenylacetate-CoA ligase
MIVSIPWSEATSDRAAQAAADETSYRQQLDYLFAKSAFYRDKLRKAGFDSAQKVGGLSDIEGLPFTTKDELRESQQAEPPLGRHLAADPKSLARIYSTSGTTGTPSFISLTHRDVVDWVTVGSRAYSQCGLGPGQMIVTAANAGPFVAGMTLDAFQNLGAIFLPVGTGNTERLVTALRLFKPAALAVSVSYATYIAEWAKAHGFDVRDAKLQRVIVAGEPGGGEPELRAKMQEMYGAKVYEGMGVGDVSTSLWAECQAQCGMHFAASGYIHVELIDPETEKPVKWEDGATGELVYTHLHREAAPLIRFRSRDHVVVWTSPCACGRTTPRIRCIGRTDDMLIVRGVNVFPSAVREVVSRFKPQVNGYLMLRPGKRGVKQDPPLKIIVEREKGVASDPDLAAKIAAEIRSALIFTADIVLVDAETLPRSDYKTRLLDYSEARD